MNKELARAYVYASMLSDEDTRVSKYQGMQQEMVQVNAQLGGEAAFIEPEILKTDRATIDRFVASEARLKPFRLYLDDIQRRAAAHQDRCGGEAARHRVGDHHGTSNIYGVFSDADFPYPTVTLADGQKVKLDSSTFSVARMSANREDRQKVMSSFFGALGSYRGTFGATLNSQIQCRYFLRAGAGLPGGARGRAGRPEHPEVGLHTPGRRRQQAPADVPSLSEAAAEDDGRLRAPLLRPLCAARRLGGCHLHA